MGGRELRAQARMTDPAAGAGELAARTHAAAGAVAGEDGCETQARMADPAAAAAERDARARRVQARSWLRRLASEPPRAAPTVKLCGLTCEADVEAALGAGADLLGFVADVPRSRRSLAPHRLLELCAYARVQAEKRAVDNAGAVDSCAADLPAACAQPRLAPHPPWSVAVCVDMPPARLAELLCTPDGPDMVQLHGREDALYIAELRSRLTAAGVDAGIIQAFRVHDEGDIAQANASAADLVLLDAGAGCGEAFDWGLARLCTRPFFLAGGLGPGNLARAVAQVRPWGVDMSSGIETNGMKDPSKMRAAVRRAHATEGEHIYE